MGVRGIPIGIHSQEIGRPESIEKVTGSDFFFPVVLPQVKEIEDISVPGLEIDGESTGAFVATLVYITRSSIIRSKHRHDAIRIAIGACNVGAEQQGQKTVDRRRR